MSIMSSLKRSRPAEATTECSPKKKKLDQPFTAQRYLHIPPAFYLSTISGVTDDSPGTSLNIQDVFSGEFKRALITNFRCDHSWLFSQVPRLAQVPVLCVEDRGNESVYPIEASFFHQFPQFHRHIPTLKDRYGVHHTKMALLQYETGLRVAIFTNNFIEQDWEAKAQGIYLQDFPKGHQGFSEHYFGPVLSNYLAELGCKEWSTIITQYDYTQARGALVPSVPGTHSGKALNRYGHNRLGVLQRTGNKEKCGSSSSSSTSKNSSSNSISNELCAQVSSIGSIDEKFLDQLKISMSGREKAKVSPFSPTPRLPDLTIAWPSQISIRGSNQGWGAGGSLCMPLRNYKTFLLDPEKQTKPYLVQWIPVRKRGNGMPHIKSYCGGPSLRRKSSSSYTIPWILLTSANLSKAAWGILQKNNSQLKIAHYELGVLIRPEYYANKELFSNTPNHPILGVNGSTPDSCYLTLMKSAGESTEIDAVTVPLPHVITQQVPFVLQGEEQPWRWQTDFTTYGVDSYGRLCDGS